MRAISIIIIIICVSIGIPPLVTGYFFKQHFYAFVDNYNLAHNTPDAFKINILEYQEGWLTSNAKLKISKSTLTQDILVTALIKHGPIIFNYDDHFIATGLGAIHQEFPINSIVPIISQTVMATSDVLFDFRNNLHADFRIPAFDINQLGLVQFMTSGFTMEMVVKQYDSPNLTISSKSKLTGIVAKTIIPFKLTVNIPEVSHSSTSENTESGFVFFSINTAIPALEVSGKYNFSAKNIVASFDTNSTAIKNMFTAIIEVDVDQLNFPNSVIKQVNNLDGNVTVMNLSQPGLTKLIDFSRTQSNFNVAAINELHALQLQVLTPQTTAQSNFKMSTNLGDAQLSGQFSFVKGVSFPFQPDELRKNINGSMDFTINRNLLNQLVNLLALENSLKAAVQLEYLSQQGDNYISHITIESGITKINGVTYTLPQQ